VLSPFSLLARQPTSLTIVSGTVSILLTRGLMGSSSVSAAYDFTRSGAGYYSIKPSGLFIYVGGDGTPKGLYAIVEDVAEVKLSGNLAAPRIHDKRASFIGCTSARQSQLRTAISSAQTAANRAYSYIQSISSGTVRYTTWFGTYTASRKSTVQNRFRLISSNLLSNFIYDCTCTTPGTDAYICTYIFRLTNCPSVTDGSLDQIPTSSEGSTCAVPSGPPPTLASIPRLEFLSAKLPALPETGAPRFISLIATTVRLWPSTTPNATRASLLTNGAV